MNDSVFNITFLGTCAADFSKKLEDEFKDCFDKDARRSSAMLINKKYLVDCGVHTPDSLRIANCDPSEISDIFITHLHMDHFIAENVERVASNSKEPVRVWVREDATVPNMKNTTLIKMKTFEKYEVCDGLSVISMPANHAQSVCPQHFIFELQGKRMFYGCDGGWLLNETYNFMKRAELALMILDCTCGDYVGDFRMGEHNSIPMIRLMLPSLKTVKAITDSTEIYLSHLAPSLHASHEMTQKIAEGFGANVAYDGLSISI